MSIETCFTVCQLENQRAWSSLIGTVGNTGTDSKFLYLYYTYIRPEGTPKKSNRLPRSFRSHSTGSNHSAINHCARLALCAFGRLFSGFASSKSLLVRNSFTRFFDTCPLGRPVRPPSCKVVRSFLHVTRRRSSAWILVQVVRSRDR